MFLLDHPMAVLFAFQSGVVCVQYEVCHPYTSGPSAAVMAASSRIGFDVGRTG